jgi:regulatory protein
MVGQKRKSARKKHILPPVMARLDRSSSDGFVEPIPPSLIEEWALAYLGHYASSAENLRRVLLRRVWRRVGAGTQTDKEVSAAIDALIVRYRKARLLDDSAYADGQVRRGQARGRSLRQIAAGLQAKGIGAEEAAAALAALRQGTVDPDLAAAVAFARRRGFGPFCRGPTGGADGRRAHAAFARAGFARQTAERVLAARDEAEAAALLVDPE